MSAQKKMSKVQSKMQVPLTPTSVTPTAVTPTAVMPTAVTPTAVTPTAVTPTAVTPTAVTPTAVTPTAVTPTAVTPTAVTPTAVTPTAVTPAAVPRFLKRAELFEYLEKNRGAEDIFERVYAFAEASGVRIRHDQQECISTIDQTPLTTPTNSAQESPRGARGAPCTEAMAMTIAETEYESDLTSVVSDSDGSVRASETASMRASETGSMNTSETALSATSKQSRRSQRGKVVSVPFTRARDGTYRMSLGQIFQEEEMNQPAPTRGSLVCRMLMSGGRGGTAVQREFSGLLFDSESWLPLATPPPAFKLRPATDAVNALLVADAYDIIRVDDGTVVTLYKWNHPQHGKVWGMASNNGYDVSSLYWMGPMTYAEVFYDLAVRRYPEFVTQTGMGITRTGKSTRLTFTKLDPSFSYTVGFRHHNFHPVVEDPERMWSIQSLPNLAQRYGTTVELTLQSLAVDLAATKTGTSNVVSSESPKVSSESPKASSAGPALFEAGSEAPVLKIPAQATIEPTQLARELGVEQLTLAHLRTAGVCAFETAIAHISGAARVFPADLAFNYGYILRLRPADRLKPGAAAVVAANPDHEHVLVETPLLTRIRRIVYERAPRTIRDRLTAEERQQFSALRAFLTPDRRDFLLIFPAWAARFTTFEKFTNSVIAEAIHILRQRVRTPPSRDPRPSTMAGHIASALLNHISKTMALTAPHRDAESILRDLIIVPENAYLFLRAMQA